MELTPDQKRAHDEAIGYLDRGAKRVIISGSAGTGKTTLAEELIKTIKRSRTINRNYNNGHIYVTAPTNKALSVLVKKVKQDVLFKTIHSACNVKMVRDKSGATYFIRQKFYGKKKGDEFDYCKAAVIDEVSMLNKDFLGGMATDKDGKEYYKKGYLEDFNFPIIFLGDDKQLNPVNEKISPIWIKGYPTVTLTEIIRQGAGNPIIDLSRNLDYIYFKSPKLVDGKGYIYSEDKQQIISDLAEVNGTDELKYLAYTNDEVGFMNKAVREKRYGNPKIIEKEETIVFKKPTTGYFTNEEVKVETVSIITDYVYIPTYETKYDSTNYLPINDLDKIRMKYYRINDSFNVVHEDSLQIYKDVYLTLKTNNKDFGWDGRGYHYFEGLFGQITYNHGITVHSSQGSTYKEAIMNIKDISYCRDAEEHERLLYTAVTRASNLLILHNL